ncbi:MAG: hypothetical protein GX591_06505 [Planctomycetes bacterium]|nr:hypothetical protein [Planctomycetota bacterium]
MTLSPRDRRALALGALGLALIVLARVAALPVLDRWRQARTEAACCQAALTARAQSVSGVLAQRGRLAGRYGRAINRPLEPVDQAEVTLLRAAKDVLGAAGFAPGEYLPQRPRQVREIPGVDYVCLEVRGQCQESKLPECLAAVGRAETLLFIDRITVVVDSKRPDQLNVTMLLATLGRRQEDTP